MDENVKNLFKKVKLLVLDVDGVLTQGEIIYDNRGHELKIFNVKDGLGVFILAKLGIKVILLSARNSPILKKRAKDMHVTQVIGGILPKENALPKLLEKYDVSTEEICFIGDDLIDLAFMQKVGLGVAVADATIDLRNHADYITQKAGGKGAVREIVDLIIQSKDLKEEALKIIKNAKKGKN